MVAVIRCQEGCVESDPSLSAKAAEELGDELKVKMHESRVEARMA